MIIFSGVGKTRYNPFNIPKPHAESGDTWMSWCVDNTSSMSSIAPSPNAFSGDVYSFRVIVRVSAKHLAMTSKVEDDRTVSTCERYIRSSTRAVNQAYISMEDGREMPQACSDSNSYSNGSAVKCVRGRGDDARGEGNFGIRKSWVEDGLHVSKN
jgi:hypothetical protein